MSGLRRRVQAGPSLAGLAGPAIGADVRTAILVATLAAVLVAGCGRDAAERAVREAGGRDGGSATVAVAANFVAVHEALARRFFDATGSTITTSSGATGQLYTQIVHGAPFDALLAADTERPRRLEDEGRAVAGSRFVYAIGRLALYGPTLDSVRAGGADLLAPHATVRVAVADPRAAPYGAAAEETLAALGADAALAGRLVRGQSIGQTYQFVRSGAAELGLVALSQVVEEPPSTYWLVPEGLHAPLEQAAVLLEAGRDNAAAVAYLAYLRSPEARSVIASHGYALLRPGG